MKSRKTIEVEKIKEQLNKFLANGTLSPDFRQGVIFSLEEILWQTGNYKGFRYLEKHEVPEGQDAGIIFFREKEVLDHTQENCDKTRVQYC